VQTLMVEWKDFIAALRKVVPVDDSTDQQLQYILGMHKQLPQKKKNNEMLLN
jgi:hypothetical protein